MRKSFLIAALGLLSVSRVINAQDEKIWTLEDCINYALEQNIQVRKNALSNQSLEYQAVQARAERLPSVNASVGQNWNWSQGLTVNQSGYVGVNGTNVNVNAGMTLFNASRLTNQIRQADLNLKGGQYYLEATRELISLNILNAYLQILYAEEQVKNSERQIESTASQLNLAAERLAMKVISQSDYAQVKSQLATEKLNLANARNQLAIAKVNLEQLMDLPVSDSFNISHPDLQSMINQNKVPDVKSVYETALAIKPQIKNAAVSKEIAALDEKVARASYYPVLSASAGAGTSYTSEGSDPYLDQINKGVAPSLGLSLAVPIFQKKQVKTSVAVARIGYQDAELNEINTKNELRKNIEQACLDVTSAQVEYEASLENYQAVKEYSLLSDEKFIQGMINSVDYLVSKTNLIASESQLLQSKYKLIFSYKILDFYLGIPFSL
jgi:outer membrane protein